MVNISRRILQDGYCDVHVRKSTNQELEWGKGRRKKEERKKAGM
jgi:hypothetical protein